MKRYTIFVCIFFGLSVLPHNVGAKIVITEIMYDVEGTDTGREWIEVENTGSEPVDFSIWKLFEANVNHKIVPLESGEIPAGSFALIADVPDKFKVDNGSFLGLLFDSAFSLSGEGETLVIRDSLGVDVDLVSYLGEWGAKGDGLSLQKTTDGRWIAAMPTPGRQTAATQSETIPVEENDKKDLNTSDSSSKDTQANSAHASQVLANTSPDKTELEVTSGRTRLGFVGSSLDFRAKIGLIKNSTSTVEHVWSMGDGTVKYGEVVSHTYRFAGNYLVILNSSTRGTEAVSKVRVHIVQPELSVIDVTDRFVEILNKNDVELNLGGWILETRSHRFVIGADTIILPKTSIRFPSDMTGFKVPVDSVHISNPLGEIYAKYQAENTNEIRIELPLGITPENIRERLITILNGYEK